MDRVYRCETEFAFALYRTQLFNPADLDAVKAIQAGYKVQTLSDYLGAPAAGGGAEARLSRAAEPRGAAHFAGILRDPRFRARALSRRIPRRRRCASASPRSASAPAGPSRRETSAGHLQAVKDGMADAWAAFAAFKANDIDTRKVGSAEVFGTRDT